MTARARLRSSRQGGQAATPDNLIHRNKVPNPVLARLSGRLEGLDQVANDVEELVEFLKADPARAGIVAQAIERVESADAAMKFLLGYYRGGADAKSTTATR